MKRSDFLIILAAFFVGVASMTCTATMPRQPDPYTIGGPSWRVFDANLITSPEALDALQREYADVEECVGATRPFPATIYSVSGIMYKKGNGWRQAAGLWLSREKGGGRTRVYVRTTMPGQQVRMTARHEFVHYILQLPHPDADPMIALCAS